MAKYISINELETFKFHDAVFKNIIINYEEIVWKLERVNVTKVNTQNNLNTDMEAGVLFLTFKNCIVTKIEHFVSDIYNKAGKVIQKQPNIIAPVKDYVDILSNISVNHGWISSIRSESKDDNRYQLCADVLTHTDSLIIDLEYSEVKAEWDSYINEAWYINFGK